MTSLRRPLVWCLVFLLMGPVLSACAPVGSTSAGTQVEAEQDGQTPVPSAPVSFRSTVERIMPSVVYILAEYIADDGSAQYGAGSGVILTEDGYILTNRHVVQGADRLEITLQDRTVFDADDYWADDALDLAVVKIPASGLPSAELGDAGALEVGDWVVAVGHPFGMSPEMAGATVTAGVVSNIGLAFYIGDAAYYDVIQTDAAINPGNSGGPLVNLDGEVVGINSAGNPAAQSVGFAISARSAQKVFNDLKDFGKVHRPYLGANLGEVTPELACRECLERRIGVRLFNVVEGGPAWNAGLRDNDVIMSINGEEVTSVSEFVVILWSLDAGESVNVEVFSAGQSREVTVVLGERR